MIKYLAFLWDKYCYGQPDSLTFAQWKGRGRSTN